ncbi:unnamed protein product [Musa acuminata var. zebrina]
MVVAVLPDVPESHRRLLASQGCIIREIEPVYPPESQTQFAMDYYVINYSKLRIWEATHLCLSQSRLYFCTITLQSEPACLQFMEHQKMVFLDADIQVHENIDHLFDLPDGQFYAVMDRFCEKKWSHTPQSKIRLMPAMPG